MPRHWIHLWCQGVLLFFLTQRELQQWAIKNKISKLSTTSAFLIFVEKTLNTRGLTVPILLDRCRKYPDNLENKTKPKQQSKPKQNSMILNQFAHGCTVNQWVPEHISLGLWVSALSMSHFNFSLLLCYLDYRDIRCKRYQPHSVLFWGTPNYRFVFWSAA